MSKETITRAFLSEVIYKQVGLSRSESLDLVGQVFDSIITALEKGDSVKIAGFATFLLRSKGQRVGRNPKTKKEVPITPRRVISFKPSRMMKDRIDKGMKKKAAA